MKLKEKTEDTITFLKEIDYPKMLLRTFALVSPIALFHVLGDVSIGMSLAFGVLMSSPSDISGSFRRRFISIAISAFLAVFSTLVMGYTASVPVLQVTVLCFLVFLYSLITVYGLRATLISFAGMFALLLSLSELPFFYSFQIHALLIGAGGLWYLLLSSVFHLVTPNRQIDEYLEEIIQDTAEYLRVRAEMIDAPTDVRKELDEELFEIHAGLNEKHEKLREMLIYKRRAGKTTSGRRELLILVELVDIFELGMANAVDYDRLDVLFKKHPSELLLLKQWSLEMAARLAESFRGTNQPRTEGSKTSELLHTKVKEALHQLEINKVAEDEVYLYVFQRLYLFKEQQFEKIQAVERVLRSKKQGKRLIKAKGGERLLPSQEYSLSELQNQFDLKSPIFRHSLRLTAIILIGYLIGVVLEDPKIHWILLTSFVIMRPGYALTKDRFKARLLGTLIGGGIAVLILLTIDDTVVFGALAVLTLMFSYPVVQKNHKIGASIITLNVVFIFGIISPEPLEIIQHRIVDTAIGAGLAFLGNSFLWPSWQYMNLDFFMKDAIGANRKYLEKTLKLYQNPEYALLDYKVARKEAFLAIGDANAAFQRMSQEPKSKQRDYDYFYKLVTLNQELLFSIASIGSFVRTHPQMDVSKEFQERVDLSLQHLQTAENKLTQVDVSSSSGTAQSFLDQREERILKNSSLGRVKKDEPSQPVSQWFETGLQDYRDSKGVVENSESEQNLLLDQLIWTQQLAKSLKKQIEETKKATL